MRVAIADRYGRPEIVRVGEVVMPSVAHDDVLVRVQASTVNRTDCAFRAARPFFMRLFTGLRRPKRRLLGTEFAGVVEGVGHGVTAFQVGDRVFGYHEHGGAHAKYLVVPAGPLVTDTCHV